MHRSAWAIDGSGKELRIDIQILRAWAVSIVVLYHAEIPGFSGGFLGVDVFFVVSGFLMTGIIAKGLERGDFSFLAFFLRRARRLLPASLATVTLVAILAPFVLGQRELQDLKSQVLGAVTFTSNIVLWRQSDYFSGDSDLKPLLHIWSLSLEEQYYLVLPLVLYLIPSNRWKLAGLVLVTLSAAMCVIAMQSHPSAAFYLLPTRAWELGIGSLCALITVTGQAAKVLRYAFWPALLCMAFVAASPLVLIHPGLDALVVCLSTALILLRRYPITASGWLVTLAIWIGNISYSLYLIHWPIISFLNNAFVGFEDEPLPLVYRLLAVAISIPFAGLMFRYVELPGKRLWVNSPRKLVGASLLASLAAVVTVVAGSHFLSRESDWARVNRPNYGLGRACDHFSDGTIAPSCMTAAQPVVLVWGDSYAMHLVPGLTDVLPEVSIAQATRSSCAPVSRIARYTPETGHTLSWATDCVSFNEQVISFIERSASIKLVVVSSPFSFLVGARPGAQVVEMDHGEIRISDASVRLAVDAMSEAVQRIRRAGKEVLLVSPPPQDGRDISRCIERSVESLPQIGRDSCEVNRERWLAREADVIKFISQITSRAELNYVSFEDVLCNETSCRTSLGGVGLYRDPGHLSYVGSVALFRERDVRESVVDLIESMVSMEESKASGARDE